MRYSRAYVPADTSVPILESTVGDLLRQSAARAGEKLALIDGWGESPTRLRVSYAELLDAAGRGAAELLDRFEPGDHVALLAPNRPEWTLVQLAAALAGMVLVTVNPALRPNEVRYILEQSESRGVITAGSHRGQDLLEVARSISRDVETLDQVVEIDRWTQLIEGRDAPTDLPAPQPSDPVMIQYTSGTTGTPKGAVLTHLGLVNSGRFIARRLERGDADIWLNPLPMFHTGGCVMGTIGAIASGGCQIVVREFDPALVLRLIEEERPTYALGVPTMIMALMEHPDFGLRDHSSLEVFSSGATTVAPELVRRIEDEFGVTYNMAMGQTESSSVIFMTRLDSTPEQKARTLGLPLHQWEVKIADEDGNPIETGTVGEICCRGFGVMAGYYKLPEATAATIDSDGWLHTGDLGFMDEDGYTSITGRLKDLIIRGGENIFPREIEDALAEHPAVAEAAVVGVPHPHWGEVPVAFVRFAGDRWSDEDLMGFLSQRLARHKVPREWIEVDSLPTNAAGKIQKFLLREAYEKSRP